MGLGWGKNSLAVSSEPFNSSCARGSSIGDRGSVDVIFFRGALEWGGPSILTRCHVARLETGDHGRIKGSLTLIARDRLTPSARGVPNTGNAVSA